MKQEILLVAATILVLGCTSGGDTAGDLEKGSEAVSQATDSEKFMVKYSETGFAPRTILVQEGDTVQWMDRSSKELYLSSNQGKPCTGETGFSSCESVENFSHTFEEEGTYEYYNENNRRDRGTVQVNRKLTG